MTKTLLDDDLKTLSSAYSNHIVHTNRLWSTGALIFVMVVAIKFSKVPGEEYGSASLFGIPIVEPYFFIATGFVSIVLGFAYCVSHIQTYRVAKLYIKISKAKSNSRQECNSSSVAFDDRLDFFHSLYVSSYNRLYPLKSVFSDLPELSWINSSKFLTIPPVKWTVRRSKLVLDFIYASVLPGAALTCWLKIDRAEYFLFWLSLLFLLTIVILPSWYALIMSVRDWHNEMNDG